MFKNRQFPHHGINLKMENRKIKQSVRLHLTNVAGVGATQLLLSLLPSLENESRLFVATIDLPNRGSLSNYCSSNPSTVVGVYKRRLPNSLSRLLECTWFARRFDGPTPIIVFGDLPLACKAPQVVFVQSTNVLRPKTRKYTFDYLKYYIARCIFRANEQYVDLFMVQTEVMRELLLEDYPALVGRVHVVAQPVPSWLKNYRALRSSRKKSLDSHLTLIYPAANYPHKNHALLSKIRLSKLEFWPVQSLILTIDNASNPAPHVPWVNCHGLLGTDKIIDAYSEVDALLFLSKTESYGFPLLESMFVGIPIVCPDLPYSRALCGDQAIYFNSESIISLQESICELKQRLSQGWWPNWERQLLKFPSDWDAVAGQISRLIPNSQPFCQNST